ncbi:MAG: hypothetical protein WBM50_17580, partial [Acidimicrobiales bacterium]
PHLADRTPGLIAPRRCRHLLGHGPRGLVGTGVPARRSLAKAIVVRSGAAGESELAVRQRRRLAAKA